MRGGERSPLGRESSIIGSWVREEFKKKQHLESSISRNGSWKEGGINIDIAKWLPRLE